MPADTRLINAMQSSDSCVTRSQVEKLDLLPPSNLAVPLDITPAILASTHHRAIASGYHRNDGGIHDVILTFAGDLSTSKAIMAKRHIDYVVICPNAPEAIRWGNIGRHGLASMLNEGRSPDWLAPVSIPGVTGLRVWQVRKDRLSAAASA
jgi:hypothetical protein